MAEKTDSAGWRLDQSDSRFWRYWDGQQWTDRTAPRRHGNVLVGPPPPDSDPTDVDALPAEMGSHHPGDDGPPSPSLADLPPPTPSATLPLADLPPPTPPGTPPR